jgi:CheY-like chemotaxis protein
VPGTHGHIPIVADEESVWTLLSRFPSSMGYETATVDRACNLVSKDFHVVISDIQMPGWNGLSVRQGTSSRDFSEGNPKAVRCR